MGAMSLFIINVYSCNNNNVNGAHTKSQMRKDLLLLLPLLLLLGAGRQEGAQEKEKKKKREFSYQAKNKINIYQKK